jgi:hypothetical protein
MNLGMCGYENLEGKVEKAIPLKQGCARRLSEFSTGKDGPLGKRLTHTQDALMSP